MLGNQPICSALFRFTKWVFIQSAFSDRQRQLLHEAHVQPKDSYAPVTQQKNQQQRGLSTYCTSTNRITRWLFISANVTVFTSVLVLFLTSGVRHVANPKLLAELPLVTRVYSKWIRTHARGEPA